MWEIENNPDVLCIDKDDTAEEFLCDAYGVVKPMDSPLPQLIPKPQRAGNNKEDAIDLDEDDIDIITDITLALDTSDDVIVDTKKETIIENLEFSDDESEDMTPLYSKLKTITASKDPPSDTILHSDKPDSSTTVMREAEALIPNLGLHKLRECRIVLERLSNSEINKALKISSEYGPSAQLIRHKCVTTINKEQRVIDTIIIDDDQSSVVTITPERVLPALENTVSDIMPKSRQIMIPKWPKPLFEKGLENHRSDKITNALSTKKTLLKPKDVVERRDKVEKKDRMEKRDKHDSAKKNGKDVTLSFDNLFNKGFNILGSGLKIAKKVSSIPHQVVEKEEAKEEVIELVVEVEKPKEHVVPIKSDDIVDEDSEAEKWCKAQDWGNDDIGDLPDLSELNIPDDDDGSNDSWTQKITSKDASKTENLVELEDEDDTEFLNMVDMTRTRRKEKFPENEDFLDIADITAITSNDANYREVMENGDDFVEGFEEDLEWRPIETGNFGDGGKWFDVDKYNYCQSPLRYADLVENNVIKSPPRETEPVSSDKQYDLWADSIPRRNNSLTKLHNNANNIQPYANQINQPYGSHLPSNNNPMQSVSQRDPRIAQTSYNRGGSHGKDQMENNSDVWKRHIESKKQNWEQHRNNPVQSIERSRNHGGYQSKCEPGLYVTSVNAEGNNRDMRGGHIGDINYNTRSNQPQDMHYGPRESQPKEMQYVPRDSEPKDMHYGFRDKQPKEMQYGPRDSQPKDIHYGSRDSQPKDMHYGSKDSQPKDMHYGSKDIQQKFMDYGPRGAYPAAAYPSNINSALRGRYPPEINSSVRNRFPPGMSNTTMGRCPTDMNNSVRNLYSSNMVRDPRSDPRGAYQPFQHGLVPLYPTQGFFEDPNLFYQYYPHLYHARLRGALFMNNRFPVPMTPASPDPEGPGDTNNSYQISQQFGTFPYYQHPNMNTTYTPASPDPCGDPQSPDQSDHNIPQSEPSQPSVVTPIEPKSENYTVADINVELPLQTSIDGYDRDLQHSRTEQLVSLDIAQNNKDTNLLKTEPQIAYTNVTVRSDFVTDNSYPNLSNDAPLHPNNVSLLHDNIIDRNVAAPNQFIDYNPFDSVVMVEQRLLEPISPVSDCKELPSPSSPVNCQQPLTSVPESMDVSDTVIDCKPIIIEQMHTTDCSERSLPPLSCIDHMDTTSQYSTANAESIDGPRSQPFLSSPNTTDHDSHMTTAI